MDPLSRIITWAVSSKYLSAAQARDTTRRTPWGLSWATFLRLGNRSFVRQPACLDFVASSSRGPGEGRGRARGGESQDCEGMEG